MGSAVQWMPVWRESLHRLWNAHLALARGRRSGFAAILLFVFALAHAQGKADTPVSFRPYKDGYWVLSAYDGPSMHYEDMESALSDGTQRWCKTLGYVDCQWSNPREVEDQQSNDRFVYSHIEYDIYYRYDWDTPDTPIRKAQITDNSRIRPARSCPPGHVLADWFGLKEENASIYSTSGLFTCFASQTIPNPKELGLPHEPLAGTCSADSTLVGNPINVIALNKIQVVADIPAAGHSPLHWTRIYNSGVGRYSNGWTVKPQTRFMGSYWRGSYDYSLEASQYYDTVQQGYKPAIHVHRPDGAVRFYRFVDNRYEGDPDDTARLEAVPEGEGGGWRYYATDDTVETYDTDGLLRTIIDRQGQVQRLTYSDAQTPDDIAHGHPGRLIEVADAQGRTLRLTYDEAGRVATVARPGGESVAYRYDEATGQGLDADMVEAIYADGSNARYSYGEKDFASQSRPHLLTGRFDALGTRIGSYHYGAEGRPLKSEGPDGTGSAIVGYISSGLTTITDARRQDRDYRFETINGRRRLTGILQPAGAGCPSAASALTYDDQGRILTRKNHNQQTTAYGYTEDGRSLENLRIEAVGTPQERTVLTDWHPDFRLPTRIQTLPTGANGESAEAAQTLSLDYDAHGNLLSLKAEGASAGAPRRWAYTYDDAGRVLTADGPRTDVEDITRFTYYPQDAIGCAETPATCAYRQGDLWKTTDALGHVAEVTRYDGAGRPLAITDANGVKTELAYTPRGWLTQLRVHGAADAVTTYDYDANGQLTKTTDPDGVTLSYTYDAAHRLTGIQDALGGRIDLTLDAAGSVTAETVADANGHVVRSLTRAFDALGRMKTLTGADGKATAFEYDAHGNLTKITRPLGQVVRTQYDALERVAQQIGDASGLKATITQEHDSQDQPVGVTDPKGLLTRYDRNGLGDLLQQHSPDTGATTQDVDAAGNVIGRTDARGQVQQLLYDALNRPIEASFDGAPEETIRYAYDHADAACPVGETYAIGRLSQVSDASGHTAYCYNALGQLTRKRQTTGDTTLELAYAYTPAGRLASLRYPDGHTAVYSRDANGWIANVSVTDAQGADTALVKDATYLPFGPVAQWRYGNGRALARHYDADGRPVTIEDTAPGGLATSFGYDANGRLTTLGQPGTDTPLLSFTYDNLDRLTDTRDGPTGTVLESYRYDLTGNRLAFIDAHGEQAYDYPADSHRLTSVAGQERRYDAMGNLLADDTRGRQFTYNAMGRMAEVRQGASVLRRYAYNAWGEQVRKTDGTEAGTTLTLYDEAGHWLGDYDHAGEPKQQTVWLGDHPVALLQADHTYYLQSDHLGTPRVVIDPERDGAVWRWDLKGEAFGSTAPDEDPDGDGAAFVLDTRFPGQRYDRATGLYYNYQRDYDSVMGRYGQSDPIGLEGGIGTYAYVAGNPISSRDPSGECPWCLVGAIVGGGANLAFQLYRNGNNWDQVDWQQVGLSAAGGMLTGGIGTLTAVAKVGVVGTIAANSIGGAIVAGHQQMASNYLQGKCLTDGIEDTMLKGGIFGGLGAGTGYLTNAAVGAASRAAFNNLTLNQQLFATSNAIAGPYLSKSAAAWAAGGTVTGNALSTIVSNANQ
ncbi:RHS repeat-associated core domain-containing protein [Dyella sp. BiH032]|uniref:RHS repeat-associated core domain-containing protein n=1 Tax=Dyella sp. BiH032 TaxID=3075430 RepID=UPI0028935714|nr:RHS repeat-associated core domain-containing protein [Dyella sp. BiH032]WNL44031.1 RHS repeat-associated core domain-containing protein [Dyella sp. BiH032]